MLLGDLPVVASVGKETFDYVYLTIRSGIPSQDRLLTTLLTGPDLGFVVVPEVLLYHSDMFGDGVLSLPSSCSQYAEHPYKMRWEFCSSVHWKLS